MLIVSDLHVGSSCGLLPLRFQGSLGVTVSPNTGQEYMLECWDHFIDALPYRIDALVINGDAIDGDNYKEKARFLCEVDPQFQARGAYELLKPILTKVRRAKGRVFLNRGSRYHVGTGGEGEEFLGEMIKSEKGPDGRRTRPWLHLNVLDVLFDMAHHQSVTIRYRSMPLEREIGFFLERMGKTRQPVPKRVVIVRSHVHGSLRVYKENDILAISTPPWKLQDNFVQMSRYPNRMFTEHVGSVGLKVTADDIEVIPYLYDHPPIVPETLEVLDDH